MAPECPQGQVNRTGGNDRLTHLIAPRVPSPPERNLRPRSVHGPGALDSPPDLAGRSPRRSECLRIRRPHVIIGGQGVETGAVEEAAGDGGSNVAREGVDGIALCEGDLGDEW